MRQAKRELYQLANSFLTHINNQRNIPVIYSLHSLNRAKQRKVKEKCLPNKLQQLTKEQIIEFAIYNNNNKYIPFVGIELTNQCEEKEKRIPVLIASIDFFLMFSRLYVITILNKTKEEIKIQKLKLNKWKEETYVFY